MKVSEKREFLISVSHTFSPETRAEYMKYKLPISQEIWRENLRESSLGVRVLFGFVRVGAWIITQSFSAFIFYVLYIIGSGNIPALPIL